MTNGVCVCVCKRQIEKKNKKNRKEGYTPLYKSHNTSIREKERKSNGFLVVVVVGMD